VVLVLQNYKLHKSLNKWGLKHSNVGSIVAISTLQLQIYKNCYHINEKQSSKLIFSRTSTTLMSFMWVPITKNQGIYYIHFILVQSRILLLEVLYNIIKELR